MKSTHSNGEARNTKGFTPMPVSGNDRNANLTMTSRFHFLLLISLFSALCVAPVHGAKKAESANEETSVPAQKEFASPKDAAKALADAVKAHDTKAIAEIFGPDSDDLVHSGDEVQDKDRVEQFAKRVSELTAVSKKTDDTYEVLIGKERWPMAIPIAKHGDKWFFDTDAGREELLNRRIGQNELSTIKTCRAFVLAQKEYFEADADGDKIKDYASKLMSDEGKKNGLYWPTAEGEKPSPMGPLVAEARAEGYAGQTNAEGERPYHGYVFHVLTKQGPKAPGGAKDYVKNGQQTEGYAFVAFPAEYGDSGIMTFMVNQDGVVMEKDLGENTASVAGKMTEYNPDKTWRVAQ